MIKPETYYEATCDSCGCSYEENDMILTFESQEEAREAITDADWEVFPSGRTICPSCS